jgi:hypothetical protein
LKSVVDLVTEKSTVDLTVDDILVVDNDEVRYWSTR